MMYSEIGLCFSNGIPFVYTFGLEGLDIKVERNPIVHYRGSTYETQRIPQKEHDCRQFDNGRQSTGSCFGDSGG